jgi:poly(3-hydroxybutyrate) depolymerase
MLYQAYQAQRDAIAPARAMATFGLGLLEHVPSYARDTGVVRFAAAANELLARAALVHTRPPFAVDVVTAGGKPVEVIEEAVDSTPFCTLLRFSAARGGSRPRVLLVAALAGHFSTLLRPTVQSLVRDHDVYVTDWHNGRDIPVVDGRFGFDEYVAHVVRFLREIGSGAHVLAVCQPCPAALAAVAVMAAADDPATPRSLTLMAGPVDTRISPTVVNDLAVDRPLEWFHDNVITTVPWRYAGVGRRVYPGFLQLGAFMSMNWTRHLDQQLNLFHALATGDDRSAASIKNFYDEYCAVLDLPAEFYLETVDRVFQRHLLPRGLLEVDGQRVDPSAITRTALLTVEGERDDICGIGQTMAAHDVCDGIPRSKRRHHLQAGVGHYGVFAGTAWDRQIYPVVRDFVLAND